MSMCVRVRVWREVLISGVYVCVCVCVRVWREVLISGVHVCVCACVERGSNI